MYLGKNEFSVKVKLLQKYHKHIADVGSNTQSAETLET